MAGYIGSRAAVATSGVERKKTFAITTTTTSLTGLDYTPNHVHVFHNGIRLVDGTDYTATNGTSITLVNAAENGDEVVVVSYGTFSPADTYTKSETYTKTEADGRYVNASGDTMTGVLNGRSFITADDTNNYALIAGRYSAGYGGAVINTTSNASFLELQVNGFGGLRADSAGRVTMPYQPSMFITGTHETYAPLVTQNGVTGTVPFNYVKSGNGLGFNTSTNTFTAQVSGNYLVSVYGLIESSINSEVRIYKNSEMYSRCYTQSNRGGYGHAVVLTLNVNDYLQVFSNSPLYLHTTSPYSGLSITLLS